MEERPLLPERADDGRFLTGPDPLQALGIRVPSSIRDRLRALVMLPGHPWSGKEPTVLGREILCREIEVLWAQAVEADPEAAAAAEEAQRKVAKRAAAKVAARKATERAETVAKQLLDLAANIKESQGIRS